jgi:hypothetical protein
MNLAVDRVPSLRSRPLICSAHDAIQAGGVDAQLTRQT